MKIVIQARTNIIIFAGLLAFWVALLPAVSQAQPAADSLKQLSTLSVEQSIQIALANNVDVNRALLSIKNARQQTRTAWSEALPQVTASGNYTRNLEVPVNFLPEVVFNPDGNPNNLIPVAFGTDNNWSGGVSVSQVLFDGEAFVGINSAKLFKTVQAESLRATAQRVVTQTRIAYHNVLIAREQVRLQQAQINRIEQNLSDSRVRYEQGLVDNYAVLQLEVQLGNLRPQLTEATYQIEEAKRNLLNIMGLPIDLPVEVEGNLSEFAIRGSREVLPTNRSLHNVSSLTPVAAQRHDSLMNIAKENRGDLRVLDLQQQLQEKQIKANQSRYLPTLSASYDLRYNAAQSGRPVFFGTQDSRARSQTIMLSLNFPLFQGFRRDAAIQQAKIELKDLELLQYQQEQDAQNEITTAEQSIQRVYETSTARKKAIDQAQTGYDRALKRYNNGLGSQQDVTDAQLQLQQAQLNYAEMVFDYLSAKAQYDEAIGLVPYVDRSPEEVRQQVNNRITPTNN